MGKKPVGRPKKDGKYVNCYVKKEITNELEKFVAETGLTKTVAIEHALKMYINNYRQTGQI